MAGTGRETGSGLSDEVLAGEYVLGALPASVAREVEARLVRDGRFAGIVQRWQDNLTETTFNDVDNRWHRLPPRVGEAHAAPALMRRPQQRSSATGIFRRSLLLSALCLGAAYAVFATISPGPQPATAEAGRLAAPLYDTATGSVSLPGISEPARIWLIGKDNAAHLAGEIAPGNRLLLSSEMQALMAGGASLSTAPAAH